MNKFYRVNVTISKHGLKDLSADYYYKTLKGAEEHLRSYRESPNYIFDKAWATDTEIMLKDRPHHVSTLIKLTECYFED